MNAKARALADAHIDECIRYRDRQLIAALRAEVAALKRALAEAA